MQLKIVVDTPEDYKKWLSDKKTLVQEVKIANEVPAKDDAGVTTDSAKISADNAMGTKITMK
jgi:cytochrome c oxidase subunit 2